MVSAYPINAPLWVIPAIAVYGKKAWHTSALPYPPGPIMPTRPSKSPLVERDLCSTSNGIMSILSLVYKRTTEAVEIWWALLTFWVGLFNWGVNDRSLKTISRHQLVPYWRASSATTSGVTPCLCIHHKRPLHSGPHRSLIAVRCVHSSQFQ